jgi:hypothetical protein
MKTLTTAAKFAGILAAVLSSTSSVQAQQITSVIKGEEEAVITAVVRR